MASARNRYMVYALVILIFLLFTTYYRRTSGTTKSIFHSPVEAVPEPYKPRYKDRTNINNTPIVDNFPLASLAHSVTDLPPIPPWNAPSAQHINESTPLFIGFTRNWRILQQVVVSYITAGWPPEDIYVVENTGVMDSNKHSFLGLQNPFFLNHTRLQLLGVNVLITPTLFTFAQLQNFYIYHSTQQGWEYFFWSHMDVVALSFEEKYTDKHDSVNSGVDYTDFMSVYDNCVMELRKVLKLDEKTGEKKRWAQRFFSYDRLALVNVDAFLEVGAWDTLIPFYMTDCDMHARLEMAGFVVEEVLPGHIYDVASSLEDLVVLYRHEGPGISEAKWIDPNALPENEGNVKKREAKGEGGGGGYVDDVESALGVKLGDMDVGGESESANSSGTTSLSQSNPLSTPASAKVASALSHTSSSLSSSASPPTSSRLISLTHSPQPKLKTQPNTISKYTPLPLSSTTFTHLNSLLSSMSASKNSSPRGRNTWQIRQSGGQGEPFYRDADGFDRGIGMTTENGKRIFAEKWGHRDCDIAPIGLHASDAWVVEHDWD